MRCSSKSYLSFLAPKSILRERREKEYFTKKCNQINVPPIRAFFEAKFILRPKITHSFWEDVFDREL